MLILRRYQASLEGFQRNGHSKDQAIALMRQAVDLTHESLQELRSAHPTSTSTSPRRRLVLSLSCYGATITPASQEYTGHYPAPYGPVSDESTIEALADWHYERLSTFASDPDTWSKVEYIAFETLPLLSEAVAIKKAMFRIQQAIVDGDARKRKDLPQWWISFVFPNGKLPGEAAEPQEIVKRVLESGEGLAVPHGIGVNCTKMRYLADIVRDFTAALPSPAWLVLYPDGGLTYDTTTRKWSSGEGEPGGSTSPEVKWAEQLYGFAEMAMKGNGETGWEGVILGGCCKAGPSYIAELAALSRRRG